MLTNFAFEQKDVIEEVFKLFDTDGQHQLDEGELASAIYALGFSQNDHVKVAGGIDFNTKQRDSDSGTRNVYGKLKWCRKFKQSIVFQEL